MCLFHTQYNINKLLKNTNIKWVYDLDTEDHEAHCPKWSRTHRKLQNTHIRAAEHQQY